MSSGNFSPFAAAICEFAAAKSRNHSLLQFPKQSISPLVINETGGPSSNSFKDNFASLSSLGRSSMIPTGSLSISADSTQTIGVHIASTSTKLSKAIQSISSLGVDSIDVIMYLFLRRWLMSRGQEALAACLEDIAQYEEIRAPASRLKWARAIIASVESERASSMPLAILTMLVSPATMSGMIPAAGQANASPTSASAIDASLPIQSSKLFQKGDESKNLYMSTTPKCVASAIDSTNDSKSIAQTWLAIRDRIFSVASNAATFPSQHVMMLPNGLFLPVFEFLMNRVVQDTLPSFFSSREFAAYCAISIYLDYDAAISSLSSISTSIGSPSPLSLQSLTNLSTVSQQTQSKGPVGARLEDLARTELTPANFERLGVIGSGSYGSVFAWRERRTGVVYAVKEMNKRMLKSKSSVHTVIRELACSLAAPLSPFVCGFEFAFCTDASIFMGMPFMEHGDLERWLLAQPTKRFDEATARFYTAQIVLGLKQLHQAGVIHRDIKASNILLDSSGNAAITDHGLSVFAHRCGQSAPDYSRVCWGQRPDSTDRCCLGCLQVAKLKEMQKHAETVLASVSNSSASTLSSSSSSSSSTSSKISLSSKSQIQSTPSSTSSSSSSVVAAAVDVLTETEIREAGYAAAEAMKKIALRSPLQQQIGQHEGAGAMPGLIQGKKISSDDIIMSTVQESDQLALVSSSLPSISSSMIVVDPTIVIIPQQPCTSSLLSSSAIESTCISNEKGTLSTKNLVLTSPPAIITSSSGIGFVASLRNFISGASGSAMAISLTTPLACNGSSPNVGSSAVSSLVPPSGNLAIYNLPPSPWPRFKTSAHTPSNSTSLIGTPGESNASGCSAIPLITPETTAMRTSFGENHGGGARFVAITALSASAAAAGGAANINAAAPPGAGSSGLSSSCMMSTGSSVVAFDRTSRSNSANMGVEGGGEGGQTFSVQQAIPIVEDTLPLSSHKDAFYRNEDLSRVSLLLTSTTPGKGLITVQAAADTLLHSCLVNPVVLVPSDCSCSTNHDDGRGWYKGRAGTSAYWCPQMLSRDSHNERLSYGVDADWWSLGCLTFALMTGRSPFATGMGTNFDNSQTLEGSAKIHWPKGLFSRESRDFVSRLCTIDPTKRLGSGPEGWKQVMSHQWFRGVDFALLEARVLPPPTMPSYRISTNWSVIPDKIDNQHKGIVAEEAAAVEASAKASADNAVLSAEDEAIFRACTFTSPMLFKRAWLQCCASKTLDELLALSITPVNNGSFTEQTLT